jgi:hypothetical protein
MRPEKTPADQMIVHRRPLPGPGSPGVTAPDEEPDRIQGTESASLERPLLADVRDPGDLVGRDPHLGRSEFALKESIRPGQLRPLLEPEEVDDLAA